MFWCSYNSFFSTFSMQWCAFFWSTTNDNSILRKLETNWKNVKSVYSRELSERDSKCRSISMRCLIYIVWSLFLSHSHWLIQMSRRLRSNNYTSICRLDSHSLYQKKNSIKNLVLMSKSFAYSRTLSFWFLRIRSDIFDIFLDRWFSFFSLKHESNFVKRSSNVSLFIFVVCV